MGTFVFIADLVHHSVAVKYTVEIVAAHQYLRKMCIRDRYARLLERAMLQELDNHQIIISKTPNLTKDICEIHKPRVVIMEVTGYSPWMLNDRLELSNTIKKNNPECKIIFMTDGDADKKLAEQIVKAKQSGYADSILFTSVSENFLAAVITSLENQE